MFEPIRVLHVLNGLHAGGIQSLLLSLHRKLDLSLIQFDYLVRYSDMGFYEPNVKELGGRVFHVPHSSKHPIAMRRDLGRFFSNHPYQITHFHYGFLQTLVPIKIAHEVGIPKRIMHAHSANYAWSGIKENVFRFHHELNKRRVSLYATDWFACSDKAAKWFAFDKEHGVDSWKFIPNGIDVARFSFDMNEREYVRKELIIRNDTICIGNVGRLTNAKNQVFALNIFKDYLSHNDNSVFLLVGEGELRKQIETHARDLGISNQVRFVGNTSNTEKYLNAMDAFIFPSKSEGLGLALIEAQANGLPCLVSNVIPKEAILCNNVRSLSLSESSTTWLEALIRTVSAGRNQTSNQLIKTSQFNIDTLVNELTSYYIA